VFGFREVVMSQIGTSAVVKNIVLVHGGFVDGSGWQGVYKALKKNGYAVNFPSGNIAGAPDRNQTAMNESKIMHPNDDVGMNGQIGLPQK
jgi:hypothetical protein